MDNNLIDLAFEIANQNYKNKKFTFDNIWNTLNKKNNISQSEMSLLHTEMLLDPRFTYIGNKFWFLSKLLTIEQISNYKLSLYDLNDKDVSDEEIISSIQEEADDEPISDSASNENSDDSSVENFEKI